MKKQLILASASPRRKKLMRAAGYKFKIIPSQAKESYPKSLSARGIVTHLALKKAQDVARKNPHAVVLGADTLVFLKKKVIGKPKSEKDARRILRQLSGSWQRVYTGVAVVWNGGKRKRIGHGLSLVKMRPLAEKEIIRSARQHRDKAGAYAVQEKRDPFVVRIRGDYDNVVGLPLRVVKKLLALGF